MVLEPSHVDLRAPAVACLLLVSGCTIATGAAEGEPEVRTDEPEVTPEPSRTREPPPPPPPDPREARCPEVCQHIREVTAPDAPLARAERWFERCVAACEEHASQGQLDCYERVNRPADLEACVVR